MDEVLLCEKFLLHPRNFSTEVKLTNREIVIKTISNIKQADEIIYLSDVIGCHILQGSETSEAKWYLQLFSYPLRKKSFKGISRQRNTKLFGISCCDSDDRNKALAFKWKRAIKCLITGECLSKDQVDSLTNKPRKKFVVYVNPFSGRGKAMQMYHSQVQPIFAEAEINHTIVKTDFAGHAKALVKDLEVEKYDGIVIISGDGLVHEVINGLMERQDWEEAIKIPIGIVPGGSGNALAASIVYASTGHVISNNIVRDSMYEIVRGRTRDLSLTYTQVGDQSYYSFLNVGWGFVADVDIESEKYRLIGNARFTVGCLVRIANLRKYHGMLSYLPADQHNLQELHQLKRNRNNSSSIFRRASTVSSPAMTSRNEDSSPMRGTSFSARSQSIPAELPYMERSSSIEKSQSPVTDLEKKSNESAESDPLKVANNTVACNGLSVASNTNLSREPYYLQNKLTQSLPPGWKSIEEEFIWVTPIYLSHLGEDMYMMPCAKIDDDVMYVYCLKATVGKVELTRILLSIENGTHIDLDNEHTMVLPCKAFRLEPFSEHTGYMTIDGELVPQAPMQASVTSIKAKVMCSVET